MKKEHKQSIKDCLAAAKGLDQLELAKVIETCKAYQASFTAETSEELKGYVTALIVGYRKLLKK
jgi:response regulator of citrate/malate metabolism